MSSSSSSSSSSSTSKAENVSNAAVAVTVNIQVAGFRPIIRHQVNLVGRTCVVLQPLRQPGKKPFYKGVPLLRSGAKGGVIKSGGDIFGTSSFSSSSFEGKRGVDSDGIVQNADDLEDDSDEHYDGVYDEATFKPSPLLTGSRGVTSTTAAVVSSTNRIAFVHSHLLLQIRGSKDFYIGIRSFSKRRCVYNSNKIIYPCDISCRNIRL
jgi:hypothetical protein